MIFHHRDIVCNEQIGQPQAILQVLEQIQDLGLHGHIQRAGRFVTDDQLRMNGQGAGNGDTLALAAGEFMRITPFGFGA